MKKWLIGCGVVVAVGVIAVAVLAVSVVGVWNTLNRDYQAVNGSKSLYSAALNTVPQKIEGVWIMSQQYIDHESKTFKEYAAARSGVLAALEGFKQLTEKEGASDSELVKAAQGVSKMLADFRKSSLITVNAVAESNPQLRAAETTQTAMRTMEAGVNEVKTALDDWIVNIRNYNTYRGSAWASAVGSFLSRFPDKIEYYEGEVKKLDIKSLNPAAPAPPAKPPAEKGE